MKKIKWCMSGLIIAFFVTGCALPGGGYRMANTEFVYPNSNVEATTVATVSDVSFCGFIISWGTPMDKDVIDALTEEAKAATGGDLLINANVSGKLWLIPWPLPITICSTELSGTGARMEIGKQELH